MNIEDYKKARDAAEFWYDRRMDESLNQWFASYEDAERSLGKNGGYLLPHKHQFLICEAAAIRALGLDPDDPDWDLIGRNVVRPKDDAALSRLVKKRTEYRRRPGE